MEPAAPKKAAELPGEIASDDDVDVDHELALRARLMAGFEYERERPVGDQMRLARKEYGFFVKQVRLGVKGDLGELFRFNTSFDLSDGLSPETGSAYTSPPYIRTATLEYRPSRAFRLQVGRFKRPFSQLELESASDLPILNRGLFNGLAIEDNQWGDRAIGMMASGRLKAPKLRWYLSLTNPSWSSTLASEGLDVLARVQLSIIKALTLGLNGGYKYIKLGNDGVHNSALGGDITLKLGGIRALIEMNFVDLPFEAARPRGLGALLLLDYLMPLNANWGLQPTAFFELADADANVSQSESIRLVLGLNVLAYEGFRIMPQVAVVRSVGDTSQLNPWLEAETYSLVFSLVL